MAQSARCLDLTAKAVHHGGLAATVTHWPEELQSDNALHEAMFGHVDLTHASAAKPFVQDVRTDARTLSLRT
jgi:hypothetical protein